MFTDFASWLQTTPLSVAIQSIEWIIPLVQSIHIVTIGIVFVSVLFVVLRILGVARADHPFQAVLRRFSPWIWIGLVVMTLTGLTLVIGEPIREFTATSFWVKMALLAVAVVSAGTFNYSLRATADREPTFSLGATFRTVTSGNGPRL